MEAIAKSSGHTMNNDPRSLRMKLADAIYVLDIQNKNPHVSQVIARYGLPKDALEMLKESLVEGHWEIVDKHSILGGN